MPISESTFVIPAQAGIQNFGQPEAGFPTRTVSGMTGCLGMTWLFGDDGITFVIPAQAGI